MFAVKGKGGRYIDESDRGGSEVIPSSGNVLEAS